MSTVGVMRHRPAPVRPQGVAWLLGSKRRAYLFLLPAVLFFAVFIGFPIFSVLQASISVHDTASRGTGLLANFSAVLHDPVFWTAAKNMLLWGVLTITIQMVVGGTLAYFIETYAARSKAVLRTAFLVPLVTSASVIAIVWEQIYAPQYGPLQDVLGHLGITMSNSLLGGHPPPFTASSSSTSGSSPDSRCCSTSSACTGCRARSRMQPWWTG